MITPLGVLRLLADIRRRCYSCSPLLRTDPHAPGSPRCSRSWRRGFRAEQLLFRASWLITCRLSSQAALARRLLSDAYRFLLHVSAGVLSLPAAATGVTSGGCATSRALMREPGQFQSWHGDRSLCFALCPFSGIDPRRFLTVKERRLFTRRAHSKQRVYDRVNRSCLFLFIYFLQTKKNRPKPVSLFCHITTRRKTKTPSQGSVFRWPPSAQRCIPRQDGRPD